MVVEMPDLDRYMTSQVPHLPRQLFRMFPTLAKHRCENDNGLSFRKECRCTEIPHLFEHLVLELQGQVQEQAILSGETQWNWQQMPRGFFSVCVQFDNELLAVGAVKLAERIIAALDSRADETLDVPAELARLRRIARLGEELDFPTWGFSAGNGRVAATRGRVAPRRRPFRRRVAPTFAPTLQA